MTAPAAGRTAPEGELTVFLERERARVDAALEAAAGEVAAGMPAALRETGLYALRTPGKRVRPILCAAAWRAVRAAEPPADAYRLAAAVEIVHTYSLVHDDLPCMDDDSLRRGRPTAHVAFGTPAAILAGAALIPAAARVLCSAAEALELAPAVRGRLVAELCRAAGASGMAGGQLLDLLGEDAPVDAAALERIHRGKTAALLAVALRLGALAAGAEERVLAALTAYGEELGLAFQIVDDVLDVTGSAEALGKTAGRDRSLGKATYPSLYGVDGARALARERVERALGALRGGGVASPELEALALFVLERPR